MSEPKPLASLSGTLLARKGTARPAMRPQVQRLAADDIPYPTQLDDLGWNDMGESEASSRHADILPLTPAPLTREALAEARAEDEAAAAQLAANARKMATADKPEVVRQQDMIAQKMTNPRPVHEVEPAPTLPEPAAKMPAPVAPAPVAPAQETGGQKAAAPGNKTVRPRRSAQGDGRRVAFTLRLDEDRHLKLRLASTVHGRSAQQLVTRALDLLLNEMPELELLAAQIKRRGTDSTN